jgi:hypothetical protein
MSDLEGTNFYVKVKKDIAFHAHAIKVYRGVRGIVPLIRNLDT